MSLLKRIADGILNIGTRVLGKREASVKPEHVSIGITTFEARFDSYFVPLLKRIRECTDCEIVVAINGEHDHPFSQDYRRKILRCIADFDNVYPIVFPQFRGLSKLWNSIVIHASHDHILMLNDDIMIESLDFMKLVTDLINRNEGKSFLINRSWSHYLISREELDTLGYFDERLLGDRGRRRRYDLAIHQTIRPSNAEFQDQGLPELRGRNRPKLQAGQCPDPLWHKV